MENALMNASAPVVALRASDALAVVPTKAVAVGGSVESSFGLMERAKLAMFAVMTALLYPELVFAQTTVQPEAPLTMLQTARSKAQNSSLNVQSAQNGGTNTLSTILIVFGVLGVACAGISGYKLWDNIQKGEQARGSNGACIGGIIFGSVLTIIAVIVGVVTNYVTSN